MSELVQYRPGRTAIITLARSAKRNALSRELIAGIAQAFRDAIADAQVRAIILTGDGPAFCAGMDLDELRSTLTAEANVIWDDAQRLGEMFDLIYTSPKPTIAAINGSAMAGGCGLTTVCDLAIAVPSAKFGYPEVRRGLVAALVLPHLLRHVGERAARYLLLTGEAIDATEAQRLGLINQVVAPEQLLPTAQGLANSIAEGGPHALGETKRLLQQFSKQALSVAELAQESAAPRLHPECRDGLTAFFDKKPLPWAIPSQG